MVDAQGFEAFEIRNEIKFELFVLQPMHKHTNFFILDTFSPETDLIAIAVSDPSWYGESELR